MNTFTLLLQDATRTERIGRVVSFVGEDATGSFGILANHGRLMTALVFGLARFRVEGQPWRYLALPGAVLYFVNNELSISTRRYLVDEDYGRIGAALKGRLLAEEKELRALKESLHRMETAILRHLQALGHETSLTR